MLPLINVLEVPKTTEAIQTIIIKRNLKEQILFKVDPSPTVQPAVIP
jgi:hypothetical protein